MPSSKQELPASGSHAIGPSLDALSAHAARVTYHSARLGGHPRRRQAILQHLLVLTGAALVLFVAALCELDGTTHVRLAFADWTIPGMCTFRRMFGLPCPGCGLTRSFVALAGGDLAAGWRFNPAGPLLFGLVAVQVPYRICQIWRIRHLRREFDPPALVWWAVACGAVVMGQWIWRLIV